MRKMLSIDDRKFTLHNKFISSSLLASLERNRGVSSKPLESSTLDRLIVLMLKVRELEKRMQATEAELKSKVGVFEERQK